MFEPILMDVFNHKFTKEVKPRYANKGVIALLTKGDRHCQGNLNIYKLITKH